MATCQYDSVKQLERQGAHQPCTDNPEGWVCIKCRQDRAREQRADIQAAIEAEGN